MPEKITNTELLTFVSHAVDIINSRPLTSAPIEYNDAPSITPNHFLKPSLNNDEPEPTDTTDLFEKYSENKNLLKRFWDRWSVEYLPLIAARSKWRKQVEPLQPGDLVLMRHELGWCRGIIKEVYPDPESGQVREVTVHTPRRTYRRPTTAVAKIRILKNSTAAPDDQEVAADPPPKQDGPMTRSRTKNQT